MEERKVKVIIRCLECGEKFRMRGTIINDGTIRTGFQKCICGNITNITYDPFYIR